MAQMTTANATPSELLPWSKGLAPRYIALFLLVVFYDQLAPRTLALAGLLPSVAGLVLGAAGAFLLFFRPIALFGQKRRARLEEVCALAFGRRAGWFFPGLLMGLIHVVWFAVAIYYAADLALRALVALGLLPAAQLVTQTFLGRSVSSPLVMLVSLIWLLTSGFLGLFTYRLVAAIMAGYQPFVAIALAVVAGLMFPTAGWFLPLGFDPVTSAPSAMPSIDAMARMIELVLGFFATHAALGADWGRTSRDRSDIDLGGFAGITLAAVATGCLGLLTVAGYEGGKAVDEPPIERSAALSTEADSTARFHVRDALSNGIHPGLLSGIVLLTLSAGLLGPACFAPLLVARFLGILRPGWPRWSWTLLGAIAAFPILAFRLPERLDLIFMGLGTLVAPLLGVLAAEWTRTRGESQEQEGVVWPAVLAWVVGVSLSGWLAFAPVAEAAIGLVPSLAGYAAAWIIAYVVRGRAMPAVVRSVDSV